VAMPGFMARWFSCGGGVGLPYAIYEGLNGHAGFHGETVFMWRLRGLAIYNLRGFNWPCQVSWRDSFYVAATWACHIQFTRV
jgi:hypothetical protein